jgi:4-hydroxythreonine-4-phosphate dehydrogenase
MNKNRNKKLRVGITLGDVNGIGPEIIVKAFEHSHLKEICVPILYGSSRVINIYRKVLDIPKFHYIVVQNPGQAQFKKLNIIECMPKMERVDIGRPSELGGQGAHQALMRAVEDAQHGELDVLITMPIDKATFQQAAGEDFSGHTELLGKAFGAQNNLMMMVSEYMKVALVTNHLPLQEVSRNLSAARIFEKLKILNRSLNNDFNIPKPLIAVLGLNPHAGDNGLIGTEEQDFIREGIQKAKKAGIMVEGPYPADGLFGSMGYQKFDGILAMYHDQGLIPFKLVSGYRGVNFTAGMPFVRTSPDHGVAYNIAGTGKADPESFRQALYTAIDVYYNRAENMALQNNALEEVKNPLLKEKEKME